MIAILLIGFSINAQEITKETGKAIKKGDIITLQKVVKDENLNDCFEVKGNLYNYLAISIKVNNLESLKFFVEKGANLENICRSKTPLMYAVKYGQFEMVKYLIEKGAKLETTNTRGKTALDYAKKYEQMEIAVYLEERLND